MSESYLLWKKLYLIPTLPMARYGEDRTAHKVHVVVLVEAEVHAGVANLPRAHQLVVGEALGHVVQVPAEVLAVQGLTQLLALAHVAVVAQAGGQGLVVVAQSGEENIFIGTLAYLVLGSVCGFRMLRTLAIRVVNRTLYYCSFFCRIRRI